MLHVNVIYLLVAVTCILLLSLIQMYWNSFFPLKSRTRSLHFERRNIGKDIFFRIITVWICSCTCADAKNSLFTIMNIDLVSHIYVGAYNN